MTAAFKPLTKDNIVEVLGVSFRTIENWVNDGTLPSPKRLGNRVYWHPAQFYDWLDRKLLSNDSESIEPCASTKVGSEPKAVKVRAKTSRKAVKSELDALRGREQAKLDAMMAGLHE